MTENKCSHCADMSFKSYKSKVLNEDAARNSDGAFEYNRSARAGCGKPVKITVIHT